MRGVVEDEFTVGYLHGLAKESGWPVEFLAIEDIGLTSRDVFVDLADRPLRRLFKLYPLKQLFTTAHA